MGYWMDVIVSVGAWVTAIICLFSGTHIAFKWEDDVKRNRGFLLIILSVTLIIAVDLMHIINILEEGS